MTNRPHDDWEELFDGLPVDTTVSEAHQRGLKAEVLNACEAAAASGTRHVRLKDIGHTLMKYKTPYWTAAAVLIGLFVWLAGPAGPKALALDEVVKNMEKALTARFNVTAEIDGQPAHKSQAVFLHPNRVRHVIQNGYVQITDWQAGKMIGLDPTTKKATVFNFVNQPAGQPDEMQQNQFDAIRQMLRKAIEDPNRAIESLGTKRLGGRQVVGFRANVPAQPMTVWADPETRLPVRIETIMAGPPKTTLIMDNYEFNIDLDESLFSTDVPAGYEVVESKMDVSRPTEEDLIEALKLCSENIKEFPVGFDTMATAGYFAKYLVSSGNGSDPTAEQLEEITSIGRGLSFVLTLPPEANAHYAGAGAKPGDATRPIFWYKPEDSDKYRVIYADISLKELDAAPQVDDAKQLNPGKS